ncbi:MAG: adenylate/guanylate cyclase domain-containing protein [Actinomycetota bacterium]
MDIPDIHYAKSGNVHIAYQVVGDGPVDVVHIPDWLSNVEIQWELPANARFLNRLASFSRLLLFDKRGSGLSDRTVDPDLFTLEVRMDDVRAVMDATGSEQAVIFGDGDEGGSLAATFAATYPDRTTGLILFEGRARGIKADDYPYGYDPREMFAFEQERENFWGTEAYARRWIASLAPSAAHDEQTVRWFTRLLRQSGSPGTSGAYDDLVKSLDMRGMLSAIHVPTLVLHRKGDTDNPVEAGRDLAERIEGSRFVELPGGDAYPWAGDQDSLLAEVEEFVRGSRAAPDTDRMLATVLFTDIVDSTAKAAELGDAAWKELFAAHDERAKAEIERQRGTYIHGTGDGLLATFDGPARAVRSAQAIGRAVKDLGLEIRAGCHTGEIELTDGDVRGIAVHIGARVAALAGPSEVLVSSTVKDLVAGSGLSFEDAGEHELKGVPDRRRLYRVVTQVNS